MKTTVEAVYEGGVFKPVQPTGFADGEHVRMTVESVPVAGIRDILDLATHVYDGLSARDIDEIEALARRRTFFTDGRG